MTNEILKSPKYYTHIKRKKNILNERAQIKCVRLTKTNQQQQDNVKSKQNKMKIKHN